ncbi:MULTISPECIES: HutD family protein [Providencia]|uniref:HutD family protein n=1 Tax=Providencia rettgeri TaxID=587 RepID=A0A3R8XPN4_PRORE|nr:HutD family protein [Providencia rettgeri]ELR5070493.1 HutD family protein [Providencia rettgeri]ELR5218292.1 HutD family protein [Providencia rettgeri]ELR5223341.1 HutD family protein [Providencia rettgeri]MBV2189042.1 HutD family protein [Providencia rettgeri]MDX7323541.1 HutD family protein [Providencia rettgeri]
MTQILTTQDYRNMPWKNGQGSTLELARSHGEGLDDFDWRVSIADVKTAGAFSFFQNRQRIIGVLEGEGLILHVDKKPAVTLKQKEFFAFNGESDVYAELVQGAIRDFNVIYNPEKYQARLQWVNTAFINSWVSGASEILIFNITPNLGVTINADPFYLQPFETLIIKENSEALQFIVEQNTENDFCIIELFIK